MIRILLICTFCLFKPLQAQESAFKIQTNRKGHSLSFKLINNLIVLPVTLNGEELTFLLDTGVNTTLLFDSPDVASIFFKSKKSFQLSGLGQGEAINAYLTKGNTLQLGKIIGENQDVMLVAEDNFAFTKRMGTQIDGILGSSFFKNHVVKIDYAHQKIKVFRSSVAAIPVKANRFPLSIYLNKPHLELKVFLSDSLQVTGAFLIDTGSSDALWLFEQQEKVEIVTPSFKDFLGQGINGAVFGVRGKVTSMEIGKQKIQGVKVAYPEMSNFKSIHLLPGRLGSIGGELLNRFEVYFDYPNAQIALIPTKKLNDPFYYNMSGIELQYNGVELIRKKQNNINNIVYDEKGANRGIEFFFREIIRYELQDIIEVAEVRPNSPAAAAGVQKGDIIQRVNRRRLQNLKLHQVTALLQQKPGKKIKLQIRREGRLLTKTFVLKPLFDSPSNL